MFFIKRHIVIPVFVPHKGCPFDCIFCNQKIISGQTAEATEAEIRKTVEDHLETCGDAFVEIGFYGGSFTGISREEQEWYLKIGYSYVRQGKVQQIRLSTRPDYINQDILELLAAYGVKIIELGAQSLDEDVLCRSNRGHTAEAVARASGLIREKGFLLGIQTMIGLPGDNEEKALLTARKVVELAPDMVRIYPTLVVKDTYLEKMYQAGKYKPLSIEEAVDLSARLFQIYEDNNIKVIRIGLQPTENISASGQVEAGPFHPAFRQLVQSRLVFNKMAGEIREKKPAGQTDIIIECSPKEISNVIGQKKENITRLKELFNFRNVKVKAVADVKTFNIIIT